ncbi:MAG TPA: hypothetical protein VEI02_10360, partial [Planctomycetota bacterium]|nr:hypothetical protein [Planctomycetota bacterium]
FREGTTSMPKADQTFKSPSMQLAVDRLRANPNVEYAEIAVATKDKGLKMAPIVFGRARLALGTAKKGKPARRGVRRGPGRSKGSKNMVAGGQRGSTRRGPGRPRGGADTNGFQAIVDHVRGLEREVGELRARMARIAGLAAL